MKQRAIIITLAAILLTACAADKQVAITEETVDNTETSVTVAAETDTDTEASVTVTEETIDYTETSVDESEEIIYATKAQIDMTEEINEDIITYLINNNEFWEVLYSGFAYVYNTDEVIDDDAYRYYAPIQCIRYSSFSDEYLKAANIDFGELIPSDYDKDRYYCDMPFHSLEEIHNALEETHTSACANKLFYEYYDKYYYEYNGTLMYNYAVSAVLAGELDFSELSYNYLDDKVIVDIGVYYFASGENAISEYVLVYENGLWKIDDIIYNKSRT
ncbi:MAG: hypothetical protein LIO69_05770 [Oscillospiraceae bacterium]|nr:hypothetical protein [Oscillospiraceae bacterium]